MGWFSAGGCIVEESDGFERGVFGCVSVGRLFVESSDVFAVAWRCFEVRFLGIRFLGVRFLGVAVTRSRRLPLIPDPCYRLTSVFYYLVLLSRCI